MNSNSDASNQPDREQDRSSERSSQDTPPTEAWSGKSSDQSVSNDREEQLALLLGQLVEQARHGIAPDFAALTSQHADVADELKELWTTALIAENLAGFDCVDPSPKSLAVATADNQLHDVSRVGKYALLEEVGRGGMGVVFKAIDTELNRTVAVKMLMKGELASETEFERFRAEAAAAAQLDHPHILPIYEVGEYEGRPYFSMKYVPGVTLAQRLATGPLPARDAAALLLPVCRAVAAAHRAGVLHRDLKPSNILIDDEGKPFVADFGLAKRLQPAGHAPGDKNAGFPESLTETGAILGTPSYMAPEQASSARMNVTFTTDVYSLGAILYATLTGRPPFQAASPLDTVMMVLEQDPVPPRLLNQKVDPDLEMVALKCLQKPPELRYASADALARDLEAYLSNEPVSARSSTIFEVVGRVMRDTHHAPLLENWGLLWMWHSLVLLVLCLVTNWFQWQRITARLPYVGLWTLGLGTWAVMFWRFRRRAGPITFVERQIAHLWGGSMIASTLLFVIEMLLGLPVLELSPVLALTAGIIFLVKGAVLSGAFYIQAAALFLTSIVMAALPRFGGPNVGISLFGVVSAACFFIPGLKYYRQSLRTRNGRGSLPER